MSYQDYKPVILRPKKQQEPQSKEKQINLAKQTGNAKVVTQAKYNAGGNKQRSTDFDVRRLDKDEGDYSVRTVGIEMGQRIAQLRNAKGMTQKDLAMAIQETASVVQQYEQGKAVPNQKILSKMEKVLGGKIRGGGTKEKEKS